MLATIGLVVALLSGVAGDKRADAKEAEFQQAGSVWKACLAQRDAELRAIKIEPERYEMALSGQCLNEEEALKTTFGDYLLDGVNGAWPEYMKAQFLEQSRYRSEHVPDGHRKLLRSNYTVWYVQSSRPTP